MTAKAKASPHVNAEEALDPKRALVPAVVRVNEQRVSRGFWPKMRKVASRIPFADDVLSLWFLARDPQTPMKAKGLVLAGLAYFVLPTDAIPDVLAGIGFTDDAAVLAALLGLVARHMQPRHKQAARAALDKLAADDS